MKSLVHLSIAKARDAERTAHAKCELPASVITREAVRGTRIQHPVNVQLVANAGANRPPDGLSVVKRLVCAGPPAGEKRLQREGSIGGNSRTPAGEIGMPAGTRPERWPEGAFTVQVQAPPRERPRGDPRDTGVGVVRCELARGQQDAPRNGKRREHAALHVELVERPDVHASQAEPRATAARLLEHKERHANPC